jgi:uncharacterized protein YbjT (DUF2867 family)
MVVITGASGYVGSHITRQLVELGIPVRALVRNKSYVNEEGRLAGLNVELVEGNVTRPETLLPVMQGATGIIHTVAIAKETGGRTYDTVNYGGTVNVVTTAQAAGIKRFINISQLGADSKKPYRFLASKGKAQEYVAESGLDWTAFRPSVIWGPEDEFANTFARLVPFSPIIYPIIGDENARFQPIWVEDVATAVAKSLVDDSTIGKEYELGGPDILTLEEIERRTLMAIGARRTMIRFPMPLLRIIVSLMEAVLPNPPVTRSLLELLAVKNVTDNNAVYKFVEHPRPFTSANIAPYMRTFSARQTLAEYLGR